MKLSNWLTINNRGSCRITKTKPGLDWNEVTMKLNVELPDSVFVRPQLSANIKIEGEINHEFDYQMKSDIKDVLDTLPNIHLLSVNVEKDEEKK